MSEHCHTHIAPTAPGYRRVLWIVTIINLTMFIVEVLGWMLSGSTALLADSLDFAGDAFTYGISLVVLNMHLSHRARASIFKAVLMALFGLWVIGTVIYQLFNGTVPESQVMGAIGLLALLANLFCAYLLFRFREGDSNMLSVWLCTRNDAIGNVAVLFAALGVYLLNSGIPDLIVATIMGLLGISSAVKIFTKARLELKSH